MNLKTKAWTFNEVISAIARLDVEWTIDDFGLIRCGGLCPLEMLSIDPQLSSVVHARIMDAADDWVGSNRETDRTDLIAATTGRDV